MYHHHHPSIIHIYYYYDDSISYCSNIYEVSICVRSHNFRIIYYADREESCLVYQYSVKSQESYSDGYP